jgi:hypothetical protein
MLRTLANMLKYRRYKPDREYEVAQLVEARTGGRIYMTKLIVAFGSFANAPKK